MHLKLHLESASASESLMHYLMHPACEYASASIDADADRRCTLKCIQNSGVFQYLIVISEFFIFNY
jgi:hypothetical protein